MHRCCTRVDASRYHLNWGCRAARPDYQRVTGGGWTASRDGSAGSRHGFASGREERLRSCAVRGAAKATLKPGSARWAATSPSWRDTAGRFWIPVPRRDSLAEPGETTPFDDVPTFETGVPPSTAAGATRIDTAALRRGAAPLADPRAPPHRPRSADNARSFQTADAPAARSRRSPMPPLPPSPRSAGFLRPCA